MKAKMTDYVFTSDGKKINMGELVEVEIGKKGCTVRTADGRTAKKVSNTKFIKVQ